MKEMPKTCPCKGCKYDTSRRYKCYAGKGCVGFVCYDCPCVDCELREEKE